MLPDPLHPAIVHFPIVLAFLLPLFAVAAIWFGRSRADVRRIWAVPLLLSAALAASSFLAVKSGEREEDRVEKVLPDGALHTHVEAAERFLVLSGVLLLIAGAGLVGGTVGRAARLITVAGSLGVTVAAVQVGKAGGDLVYRHNAASVYSNPVGGPAEHTRE
jgi:uncharacterized membrane protein